MFHMQVVLSAQLTCEIDKLNAETDSWDQKMYINDELVSELTTSRLQQINRRNIPLCCRTNIAFQAKDIVARYSTCRPNAQQAAVPQPQRIVG